MWCAANILTLGRLILVPFFLAFFILRAFPIAFVIFAVASFTDLIDGTIARLSNTHSQFGALLDPIADKLLMITAFSCLVSVRALPLWILVLVILRDAMIMGGIALLKILKIDVKYEPTISSKLTTLSQIALGMFSLGALWEPIFSFGPYPIVDFAEGCTYVTALLIFISGLQYMYKGLEILNARKIPHDLHKRRDKTVSGSSEAAGASPQQ